MTIDLTDENVAYVIARLERAEKDATLQSWRSAGRDAHELLTALREQRHVEVVLPAETYTEAGLPRRAASRAREHGATIYYTLTGIMAEFPNGSSVHQFTSVTRLVKGRAAWRPRLDRHPGAAPGCNPPAGTNLEDVLNAFADQMEAR
jgi:hypothetical protein